jgi:hypothetical protein
LKLSQGGLKTAALVEWSDNQRASGK